MLKEEKGDVFIMANKRGTLSINKWMNLNNIQFIVDDVILE